MEISLIGNSQAKLVNAGHLVQKLNPQIFSQNSRICFVQATGWGKRSPMRLALRAAANSEALVYDEARDSASASRSRSKPIDGVKLYVGLPLDAVSACNTINHARAITAGLKALKLLGVDGVELPVWWGIAEKEAMGKYEWSGYLKLAEMVQKAGLKLHISLCFHASKEPKIPLPDWVSQVGESQPSIFFTDRSGKQYRDCLSLSVDDLPVLDGKSPIQAYGNFCESFKSSFSAFLGSTITGISIGLGPDGELRYPSHHQPSTNNQIRGVGEFQSYDENMVLNLKQHAEAFGNPLWGLSGPHDSPTYDELPSSNNFAKENGGSWETAYGDFFLSWYSNNLTSHLDRLLSLASSTFSDYPVKISGKVPLMHSSYKTRSHPSELTAGFYNTVNRHGYDEVVEIFAKNSCKVILPGMDLSDEHQPDRASSSPESLLRQILTACKKHDVEVSGQNSSISGGGPNAFNQIKRSLLDDNESVDLFTYQRMGAAFFSPDHFPKFAEFVRSLNQPELGLDDLPSEEGEAGESIHSEQDNRMRKRSLESKLPRQIANARNADSRCR